MKGTLTGRCETCGEHHAGNIGCPPHEVRTTGVEWYRQYIEELEAEVAHTCPLVHCRCGACGVAIDADGFCGCDDNRRHPIAGLTHDMVSRLRKELQWCREGLTAAHERINPGIPAPDWLVVYESLCEAALPEVNSSVDTDDLPAIELGWEQMR